MFCCLQKTPSPICCCVAISSHISLWSTSNLVPWHAAIAVRLNGFGLKTGCSRQWSNRDGRCGGDGCTRQREGEIRRHAEVGQWGFPPHGRAPSRIPRTVFVRWRAAFGANTSVGTPPSLACWGIEPQWMDASWMECPLKPMTLSLVP